METSAVEQPTVIDSSASKKEQRSEFKKAIVKILSCIVNELVGPECFSSTEVDSTVARKAPETPQEPIQQQPLPKINQLTQALAATCATGAVSSASLPPGAVSGDLHRVVILPRFDGLSVSP